MSDEHKLLQERERAVSARRILEDPLYQEATTRLDTMLVSEWKSCADPERRERIWTEMKILRAFQAHFATLLQTGQLATEQLGQIEEAKKRGFFANLRG